MCDQYKRNAIGFVAATMAATRPNNNFYAGGSSNTTTYRLHPEVLFTTL
jgi:hypothetical protein